MIEAFVLAKTLNRVFLGKADKTLTVSMARKNSNEIIARSDYFIDVLPVMPIMI